MNATTVETPQSTVENGQVTVKLGGQNYLIIPQRIGYLRSKMGKLVNELTDLQIPEGGSILDTLGGSVHTILSVFIPDFMPEWEFEGLTKQAFESRATDRERIGELSDQLVELVAEPDEKAEPGMRSTVTLARSRDDLKGEDATKHDEVTAELEKLREHDYYDAAADRSPSPDEVVNALEVAMKVNRLDLIKSLKNVFGPEVLRALGNQMTAELLTRI